MRQIYMDEKYTTYSGKKEWCVRKIVCPHYRNGSCNGCKGFKKVGDRNGRIFENWK